MFYEKLREVGGHWDIAAASSFLSPFFFIVLILHSLFSLGDKMHFHCYYMLLSYSDVFSKSLISFAKQETCKTAIFTLCHDRQKILTAAGQFKFYSWFLAFAIDDDAKVE